MHPDLVDELSAPPHLVLVRGRARVQCLAQRACQRGHLVRLLPGVYAAAGQEGLQARAVALAAAHPDAVIHGHAAAALTWWPEVEVPALGAMVKHETAPFPGFRFVRGVVPPESVVEVNGIRLTDPARTVLDLVPDLGGVAIDEALRRGVTTLEALWESLALSPRRAGNAQRRWLLEDSRDQPWSPAERLLHRGYRGLGLRWRYCTNHPVALPTRNAFLDLALPELRLGFEVDGYEEHSRAETFHRDRTRDPELTELGWIIVRFDAADLLGRNEWVLDRVRGIIAGRAVELGLA